MDSYSLYLSLFMLEILNTDIIYFVYISFQIIEDAEIREFTNDKSSIMSRSINGNLTKMISYSMSNFFTIKII